MELTTAQKDVVQHNFFDLFVLLKDFAILNWMSRIRELNEKINTINDRK